MFHNRTFKVLSNLILLVIFCTGQVAAAPRNTANEVKRNPLSLSPSIVNEVPPLDSEFSRQTLMAVGETIRASVSTNSIQGNQVSWIPSVSADGRYVAFTSLASNLVTGDTNGYDDVFVRDLQTSVTTRISIDSNGKQGNGGSWFPSISADGRYVAFYSSASNLVSGDTNGFIDVFVHDRQMGNIIRVSISSDDEQGTYDSFSPSISADGRYVEFASGASNLVNGDTNGIDDVFVHDTQTGSTTRVSVASDGTQQECYSGCSAFLPSISGNGIYVVFGSNASNLVSDDTNGFGDVFVHNMLTGETKRISVDNDEVQGNSGSYYATISNDGNHIAFGSDASNLVSGDTNGFTDVFVRDMQANTTTRISLNSSGGQGNNYSQDSASPPSISADGRYVAFDSYASNLVSGDTNSKTDVFLRDTQTNTTTRVSLDSSGMEGNSYSYNPSISADGLFVAFYSEASNLVSGDTNGVGDIFVHGDNFPVLVTNKPPLILVHGFQGLVTGYHCSDGIPEYDGTNSTLESLPDWFSTDYRVYIAHLDSSKKDGTPSLITNAKCLSTQIDSVALQNPNKPITIVAHSMGGLVSRAAFYMINPYTKVSLYTLGSPHAGFPFGALQLIYGHLKNQPAVYNMADSSMVFYNGTFKNKNNIKYYFIGGDATWGGPGPLVLPSVGANDGFVGKYSAMGWNWPYKVPVSIPPNWQNNSLPGQYWTNEFHISEWGNSYYSPASDNPPQNYSHAFECMKALMRNTTSAYCQDAKSITALSSESTALSTPSFSAFTEIKNGHLNAGQSISIPLEIDTNTASLFYLTWSGDTPTFTLTRPDAQVINSAYAATHPLEVTYENLVGGAEVPPNQTYNFNNTQSGIWQLNINATTAIDYQAFATLDSSRFLISQTNAEIYQIGDTASITANLANGDIGLSGATVTAKLTRSDTVVDTVPLVDQGNGTYTTNYVIPNSSGYLTIDVTASGTDSGAAFTRQNNLQVAIQSDNLQMTGVYSDTPNDNNSDSMYEYLDFAADVNLAAPGEYAVSAELYAGDQLITQAGDFFPLIAGTHTITLSFDGREVNKAGLNGPYTVKNLYFTPNDTGITAQSVETAWTTGAYSFSQFVDGVSPVVSNIIRTNTNPSSAANINFTVTFSEPVTDVDATDFILTTTRLTGSSIISVTGSDSAYTIAVNTGTGNGTIRLDVVDNNTIADLAHNLLGGAGVSNGDFTRGQIYTIFKLATFADVPLSYWSSSSIERLYNAGITGGCSAIPLNYCPSTPVTRAQMAIFLLRGMHGKAYTPPPATGTKFNDVPLGAFAAAWIEQLSTEGITSGCGGGNYCPNTTVSRAQMAIFLVRAKHGIAFVPPTATGIFPDVPIGSFGANYIEQLVADAVTSGCGGGNYCPNTMVKRDSMAVFLVKTFNLP